MVAWNAIERLNWRKHVLNEDIDSCCDLLVDKSEILNLEPVGRLPIGADHRQAVAQCHIRAPRVKLVF